MTNWILPDPPKEAEYDFKPIVRASSVIPFGYKVSEDDEHLLLPVHSELVALERAKKLLKEYSFRVVADWLTKETGREISHEGLRKRVNSERKRKRSVAVSKQWAEKYKKAMEEAERVEAKLGGSTPERREG